MQGTVFNDNHSRWYGIEAFGTYVQCVGRLQAKIIVACAVHLRGHASRAAAACPSIHGQTPCPVCSLCCYNIGAPAGALPSYAGLALHA